MAKTGAGSGTVAVYVTAKVNRQWDDGEVVGLVLAGTRGEVVGMPSVGVLAVKWQVALMANWLNGSRPSVTHSAKVRGLTGPDTLESFAVHEGWEDDVPVDELVFSGPV